MGLLSKTHLRVNVGPMLDNFFDPPIEQVTLVLIGKSTIAQLERKITACEACDLEAEIPLDWILDKITGRRGPTTDYILETPAHCQGCGRDVTEETLVQWSVPLGIFRRKTGDSST